MTESQTADLLSMVAAYDRRTTSREDVAAWWQVLREVDFGDACQAVADHFATDTGAWLMPGRIRAAVKAAREQRINRANPHLLPSADPDATSDYAADLRRLLRLAADGQHPAPAIEATPTLVRQTAKELARAAALSARVSSSEAIPGSSTATEADSGSSEPLDTVTATS